MPRQYGSIHYRFWTGNTGRALRGHPNAQVLGAYLMSCGAAHMSGLYAIALPSISHETGIPPDELETAFETLKEEGYAFYDTSAEVVWVPQMAKFNVGPTMKESDNNRVAIAKHLADFHESPFVDDFLDLYGEAYHLSEADIRTPPSRKKRQKEPKSEGTPRPPSKGVIEPPPEGVQEDPSKRVSTDPIRTEPIREEAEARAREPAPPTAAPAGPEPAKAEPAVKPEHQPLLEYLRREWPDIAEPANAVKHLADACPGVDLLAEAKHAKAWLETGGTTAKPAAAFLRDWLKREAKGAPIELRRGPGIQQQTGAGDQVPVGRAMSREDSDKYLQEKAALQEQVRREREAGVKPPKLVFSGGRPS